MHHPRRSSSSAVRGLIAAGSLQPATGRLSSRRQGFSTGAPQPIGSVPASFGARYPNVRVEEDRISIADGPVWAPAGMTAGIDLALALIEEDLGPEAARTVARSPVLYHRRAGGQSQFSSLLELEPKSDRIQTVLNYARRNLAGRLSVDDLAEVVHLSPRQFSRAFRAETSQTPAKAVENLRLE